MTNYTQQTRFWNQLKSFGIKRFIFSPDLLIAIAIFAFMLVSQKYELGVLEAPQNGYMVAIFAAASTLFAITLAALAIILSFSSSGFATFLRERNKLSKILFLFWSGNAAYLIVLVLSLVYLVLNPQTFNAFKELFLYPAITSVFVYALINTFYILGAVVRFGYFLDFFDNQDRDQTKNDE